MYGSDDRLSGGVGGCVSWIGKQTKLCFRERRLISEYGGGRSLQFVFSSLISDQPGKADTGMQYVPA
jgi:hypothetical protein